MKKSENLLIKKIMKNFKTIYKNGKNNQIIWCY